MRKFLGSQKVSVSGVSSRGPGENTLEGAKSLSEITPEISGKIPHCLKPFITLPGVNACGQARERRLLKLHFILDEQTESLYILC